MLRCVIEEDLPVFFEQQLDREANFMAAFTARDPADRESFDEHLLSDNVNLIHRQHPFQRTPGL